MYPLFFNEHMTYDNPLVGVRHRCELMPPKYDRIIEENFIIFSRDGVMINNYDVTRKSDRTDKEDRHGA